MGLLSKKFAKYYEYIMTKLRLLIQQKSFSFGGVKYNYLFEKADSEVLVVVFSSCTRKGIKARYNYVRTLKSVNANKLFILDDFADDHRGSYYIGENMQFNEEAAALSLINHIKEKAKAKKVICCGSSKGGWASLNFGLQIPGSYIVAGGPQFFLGSYLKASGNIDALNHIVGEVNDEKIALLDSYLSNRVNSNSLKSEQKIYLHYSDAEHTYEEHIKYLVSELEKNGYSLVKDIAKYANHSDISLYFPDFLKKTVANIISED